MRTSSLLLIVLGLTCASGHSLAQNAGDFSGGVAIGTGYAGVDTAPTDGLIVQGYIGVGSSSPIYPVDIQGSSFAGIHLNNSSGRFVSEDFDYASSQVGTVNYDNNDGYFTLASGANSGGGGAPSGLALATYSVTPVIFFTDNIQRMQITGSGTVGIGTTTPRGGSTLDVNGTIYVGSFASSSSTTVCQNGNVLSSCTSALRFKQNVRPSQIGLNEVLHMQPVVFDQRNHRDNWEKHDFGFIAEDMAKINPLFVTYDDKGEINGVRYMQLTAVEAKAIQELHFGELSDVRALQEEVTEQQGQIDKQQAEIKRERGEIDALRYTVDRLAHQGGN